MAVEKIGAAAAQVDVAKPAKKSKTATGPKKTAMQRVVDEAKATYADLDQSAGRKMRKRPAPTNGTVAPKAKKAAAKKPAAAKKAKKATTAAVSEENKNNN
jgi:hypothetical protein